MGKCERSVSPPFVSLISASLPKWRDKCDLLLWPLEPLRASGAAIAMLAASTLAIILNVTSVAAQQTLAQDNLTLVRCDTTIRLEKRLQLDRWAKPGECSRANRARHRWVSGLHV